MSDTPSNPADYAQPGDDPAGDEAVAPEPDRDDLQRGVMGSGALAQAASQARAAGDTDAATALDRAHAEQVEAEAEAEAEREEAAKRAARAAEGVTA